MTLPQYQEAGHSAKHDIQDKNQDIEEGNNSIPEVVQHSTHSRIAEQGAPTADKCNTCKSALKFMVALIGYKNHLFKLHMVNHTVRCKIDA
jgi:hypothetical protein